jgi:rSAM/selenodomain-associated transferase 2
MHERSRRTLATPPLHGWNEGVPAARQDAPSKTGLRISVVIPTLNEAAELPATITAARRVPEVAEIIVADGGSTDATVELGRTFGCLVLNAPRGRGTQMHHAALRATGDIVLLLHADTWLKPDAGRAIIDALAQPDAVGGGCYKVFRDPAWLMRGSRFRCWLRFQLGRRFLGDQAMFARRDVLERIGGVPAMPLMEEFVLGRRLREQGRLVLAHTVVNTSARRFHERGILRTYLRMGWVTLKYLCGTPPEQLQALYQRK